MTALDQPSYGEPELQAEAGHRPALAEMRATEKNGTTTMSESLDYLSGGEVEAIKVEDT